MPSSLQTIVPLIPSGEDFAAGLSFFVEEMGFKVVWEAEGIAGITRDNIAFNIVQNSTKDWADNASFSIGVSELENLYEEYKNLPTRVGALEIKPWGRREFHVVLGSGVCLQFFEVR